MCSLKLVATGAGLLGLRGKAHTARSRPAQSYARSSADREFIFMRPKAQPALLHTSPVSTGWLGPPETWCVPNRASTALGARSLIGLPLQKLRRIFSHLLLTHPHSTKYVVHTKCGDGAQPVSLTWRLVIFPNYPCQPISPMESVCRVCASHPSIQGPGLTVHCREGLALRAPETLDYY